MKLFLIIWVFPIIIFSQAEEKEKGISFDKNAYESRIVTIEFNTYVQIASPKKNEFLDAIYDFQLGFGLGTRISYKGLFGLGMEYLYNNSQIKDQTLIGPFETAKMNRSHFYAFGQMALAEGLNIEAKIGGGQLQLKHFWRDIKYNLIYNHTLVGSGLYYSISESNSIRVFINYEINFIKASSRQNLPQPYENQFSKTRLSTLSLGLKFSL